MDKDQEINVISVSGGKDSTAMLLLAIERGTENIRPVFCDTGLLLLADRLSYDLEEGEEFRREIEPAWRQVDAAWRIWQEKHVIAQENLLQAEALLQSLIELFKGFTYKEMDQALHYVMKHHLKPVRVMKEEGLIE